MNVRDFGYGPGRNMFTNEGVDFINDAINTLFEEKEQEERKNEVLNIMVIILGTTTAILLIKDIIKKYNARELTEEELKRKLEVEKAKAIIAAHKAGLPLPTFEGVER